MTSLVWEDRYNTGVEAIDAQHRKIFDYMTDIYHALADNQQKCDAFNGMLDQLELLCQMHFLNEQQMVDDINYPSVPEHKRLHDLFLTRIDLFKIDSKQCHTPSILNNFTNLREDFITHMLNETTLFCDFINNSTKDSADISK